MSLDYKGTVLVVDDDKHITQSVSRMLGRVGFRTYTTEDSESAMELLERQQVDVVLMDINMGINRMTGLDALRVIKSRGFSCEVIIMTGLPSVEKAVEAEKRGAFGYLEKPFTDPEKVRIFIERASEKVRLQQENSRLQVQLAAKTDFSYFVGKSPKMQALYNDVRNFAFSSSRVLILGETGSGKELVARALHDLSPRRDKPFQSINAAALSSELATSELFGHVKGSFTGATADKVGMVESADGGTLFIDEVAELALPVQATLLRFLNEGRFRRVGGTKELESSVRIIAATNQDLDGLTDERKFRSELLNRLETLVIRVPPLRERPEDIPALAWYFLRHFAEKDNRIMRELSQETIEALQSCAFRKGNVRALQNAIQFALASGHGTVMKPEFLPGWVFSDKSDPVQSVISGYPYIDELTHRSYREAKKEAEVHFAHFYFSAVLKRCNGVINEVARNVEIEAPNLRKKLKEIKLDPSPYRKEGAVDDPADG